MNVLTLFESSPRTLLSVIAAITYLASPPLSLAAATPATGAIADGPSHRVLLKADGTVWTIGNNYSGQLGDGSTTNRPTFAQVPSIGGVSAVAAGSDHTVVLKTDGTVWGWGYNGAGQLGDGTTIQRNSPVQVTGLSAVVAIASQYTHTVALKSDGTVWTWGANGSGQLGDGTMVDRTAPVQVTNLTGVVAIAAGHAHTLAVKSDGTVWGWGWSAHGQLGDVASYQQLVPIQTSGLTDVTAVAAGAYQTLVLRSDGTVWAFGIIRQFEIQPSPVAVSGIAGVSAIAGAADFQMSTLTIAAKSDGTAWTWAQGEVGGGVAIAPATPTPLEGISDVVRIAASAKRFGIVRNDGSVWSSGSDSGWGSANSYGEFGDGTSAIISMPVQMSEITDATSVAAGMAHTLVLSSNGLVRGWGSNSSGELGNGATTHSAAPVQASGMTGVIEISTAKPLSHSTAVKSDGTVWGWGSNWAGQLGDGTTIDRTAPVQVSGLSGAVATAAGGTHALALRDNGTVFAWGSNSVGQLGDGTTTDRITPVQVSGLTSIVAVAASSHSVALKSDGTVWCWGFNSAGQLGDGTTVHRSTPVQVAGLTGVVAIKAGGIHTVALKSDGTVWGWGYNSLGALGDGTVINRTTPVQAVGVTGVTAISATLYYSAGIKADGTAFAWGSGYGSTPAVMASFGLIAELDGGLNHTMVIRPDGTVWGWGRRGEVLGVAGRQLRRAAIRLVSIGDDGDQDGMSDAWEIQHFVNLSQAGYTDTDGDGLTDIEEFSKGSNPTQSNTDGDRFTDFCDAFPNDYYNDETPTLAILSGSNQSAAAGEFNAQPFDVAVWNTTGTEPLVNAPIVFSVTQGGGSLAMTNIGTPPLFTSGTIHSDVDGTGALFYQQPATEGVSSQITVSAGAATPVVFLTQSMLQGDSDENGLTDQWEIQHFGMTGVSPSADPDGDGLANLQEFQQGTNPTDYFNGKTPIITVLSGEGNPDGEFVVKVHRADGTPYVNAPVSFEVPANVASLAGNPDSTILHQQIGFRTNPGGIARVYIRPGQTSVGGEGTP